MIHYKHGLRPTIGILAGWQLYEGSVSGFLDLILRSIHSAGQDCNLLSACGLGHAMGPIQFRPAWPVGSSDSDFVPVGPWNTDGLIVINPLLDAERSHYIQQIRKEGHPVVFVGPGEEGRAVVADNGSGIHQAVAHLVQHGHRRIAYIAGYQGEVDIDSLERFQAYQAAVREFGLENDPSLIAYGSHNYNGGRQAMKRLLESGGQFRAVLASNDQSAFGAAWEIQQANLLIPQDIAIVGFDDTPEAASQEPSLTTVHYPSAKVGERALALLLETINGHSEMEEVIKIPMQLIVRESCGCRPGNPVTVVPIAQTDAYTIALSQLIRSILEVVRSEISRLGLDEIEVFCKRLVEDFVRSLQEGNPAAFHKTFVRILQRMEELGDNPNVWHPALSLLEQDGFHLPIIWDSSFIKQAEAMLLQARTDISASMRKQHWHSATNRGWIADQISLLTSYLFMAVDKNQIFQTLRVFLPSIGVDRADVGFYEAQGDDLVAWSLLYPVFNADQAPIRFVTRQFPPNGFYPQDRPFHLALFPLLYQGQVDGFISFDSLDLATCVMIARQLTAAFRSVRSHQEAVEGRRLAEEGRKLAEEANYIKSRFLSTVSHELRTPLNLIVGLSNLVLQEEMPDSPSLPPSLRQDLEQIHTNAEHLGRLIRDVLDLATSQAGQLRLELEPLDLVEALRAAVEAGEELARQKGLEWKVSLPEEQLMVMGDRTRLRQVLLNLISNAVKFTEHGRIEVRIEGGKGEVLVSVRDTGLGIAVAEQSIIFDEFRQSERTTARGYGGMGLGLAISRRLVELHGGQIGVQSSGQEGAGSTFYFTLPVLKETEPAQPAARQRIVLLAWQAAGSQPLREHLIQQGFEVELLLVEDGFDWAARVMAAPPAAVVVDSDLAAGQGWEILKVLKGQSATRQVPVLFYSLSEEGGKGSLLELDYLVKPLAQTELTRVLTQQGLLSEESLGETRTILVVDDEPGTLALNVRMVQSLSPGYQVLTARNGRQALELMQSSQPDLVLLDLMMPEMDGFGVLEAMRAGETTRDIPVVVLTAQVLTEADMARLNQGVAAVLGKGLFSLDETLAHVEQALGRHQKLGSETQRLVRKAMAYLHTHYAESISREALARHVAVHKNYLTECFRRETGLTPFAYLQRYRINRAKALLAAGEKNVGEVAEAVGFSNISYFSRAFQKEVKVAPGAYRRGQRPNTESSK